MLTYLNKNGMNTNGQPGNAPFPEEETVTVRIKGIGFSGSFASVFGWHEWGGQ